MQERGGQNKHYGHCAECLFNEASELFWVSTSTEAENTINVSSVRRKILSIAFSTSSTHPTKRTVNPVLYQHANSPQEWTSWAQQTTTRVLLSLFIGPLTFFLIIRLCILDTNTSHLDTWCLHWVFNYAWIINCLKFFRINKKQTQII